MSNPVTGTDTSIGSSAKVIGASATKTVGPSNKDEDRPTSARGSSPSEDARPQRASHACHRCKRMKLRCVGGIPCERCKRAKQPCDGETALDVIDGEAGAALRRIAELEQMVRNLVNHSQSGAPPGASDVSLPPVTGLTSAFGTNTQADMPNVRFDLPAADMSDSQRLAPFDAGYLNLPPQQQVSMQHVPSLIMRPDMQQGRPQAMAAGGQVESISPQYSVNSLQRGRGFTEPPPTPPSAMTRDSPASRLAVAQDSSIMQPPFRPLLIRARVWDNKQPSRPGSPSSSEDAWYFEGRAGPMSDPVSESLVSLDTAHKLFDFFFAHSNHFLPIIHFARQDVSRHDEIRQRSPFLYTVILAIGARHYQRSLSRSGELAALDDMIAANIRQLAYSHLAAVVMRKEHAFPDVQAILILSVWGLQGQGKGPDPWLLTGVVERMSHRLELQRAGQSAVVGKVLANGIGSLDFEERVSLDRLLTQWKSCLSCYYFDHYLSLGFGRPQSNFKDQADDELFVQLVQQRSHPVELAGDVYIASQVQLSKIARDLMQRATALSEKPPVVGQVPFDSVTLVLRDLNKRLDDWQRRWTWSGARGALQMNRSSLRFAKLQGEHIRLSVNAIALKADAREASGSNESDWLQTCVVKAMDAAISLIDMHIEASETDLLFSYSFEYIFNALAQAALYLIRLYLARQIVPVETSILIHYIRSAIQVIEQTDLSFTRHSTTIAQICRDICRVAGIDLTSSDHTSHQTNMNPIANDSTGLPADFDFEAFLHLDGMGLDLGFMFNDQIEWPNGYAGGMSGQ